VLGNGLADAHDGSTPLTALLRMIRHLKGQIRLHNRGAPGPLAAARRLLSSGPEATT